MANLLFVALSLLLLAGFVVLTRAEARRGARVLAPRRTWLDEQVERVEFIVEHVDLAAFLKEEVRRLVGLVSHGIALLFLQGVRLAERLLTRLVRHLRREHVAETAPRENAREFVKTLADFKETLKETAPEVPEITPG